MKKTVKFRKIIVQIFPRYVGGLIVRRGLKVNACKKFKNLNQSNCDTCQVNIPFKVVNIPFKVVNIFFKDDSAKGSLSYNNCNGKHG